MIAFITELNEENFKSFINNDLALVDIKAEWCGPCKMISPIVDEISNEYQGKLSVGKLDADNNRGIVSELGIRSIPTLLLYKNGEIIDKLVGGVNKQKIVDLIEQYI
jgi:thioredoxin 1